MENVWVRFIAIVRVTLSEYWQRLFGWRRYALKKTVKTNIDTAIANLQSSSDHSRLSENSCHTQYPP